MANDKLGDVAWLDLTVNNAEQVKDFYQDVIGWKSEGSIPIGINIWSFRALK